MGPIVIQGDHGPVAFRNIKYRKADLHKESAQASINTDIDSSPQIYVKPGNEIVMHRSFIDYKKDPNAKSRRITHAISVGEPSDVHYAMDLGSGALLKVWKGGFVDATPMWHNRGNGSSRSLGSVILLSDAPNLAYLSDKNGSWPTAFDADMFRSKGYEIDPSGRPIFKYMIKGMEVTDHTIAEEDGKVLTREIKVNGGQKQPNLYCRLAEGADITTLADGTYSIDNKAFYVKIGQAGGAKPVVRDSGGRKELVIPMDGNATSVKYSIIW
jgi:hypothetical protein